MSFNGQTSNTSNFLLKSWPQWKCLLFACHKDTLLLTLAGCLFAYLSIKSVAGKLRLLCLCLDPCAGVTVRPCFFCEQFTSTQLFLRSLHLYLGSDIYWWHRVRPFLETCCSWRKEPLSIWPGRSLDNNVQLTWICWDESILYHHTHCWVTPSALDTVLVAFKLNCCVM